MSIEYQKPNQHQNSTNGVSGPQGILSMEYVLKMSVAKYMWSSYGTLTAGYVVCNVSSQGMSTQIHDSLAAISGLRAAVFTGTLWSCYPEC